MRIEKVLNNNVAIARKDGGEEVVVMGRGIAFQRHAGDSVSENLIEKIFTLQNDDSAEKLSRLVSEIPIEHILIAEDIISLAEKFYREKLHDAIHISLADHISTAIGRYNAHMNIKNPLRWDIERFYPEEYDIGKHAIEIIYAKTGLTLEDDEAAFIAMHFVNAEMNQDMSEIVSMTRIMNEILSVIKKEPGISLDENSVNYYRFITHLKFFAQRITENKRRVEDEEDLYNLVKQKYSDANALTEKISLFIEDTYKYVVDDAEKAYFTIHLQRLIK